MTPDPLTVALVGCGEVTRCKHLPALARTPGIEVVAVADLDSTRLHRIADQFQIPHRLPDTASLLALPGLDALGIATPPETHARLAVMALEAGKHVWIDKPLALSSEDCERIVAAARHAGRVATVGFHMRQHRLLRQARAIVASGRLGAIESIRTTWNSPMADRDLPPWRFTRDTGGGALAEIGVHTYDLWRYLLGAEVRRVFAVAGDGTREDEWAVVTAELDGGIAAVSHLSERTSHAIEVEITGRRGRLRVDCLRVDGLEWVPGDAVPGSARTRLRRLGHLAASLPEGWRSMRRGGEYRHSYRLAWEAFAAAARGRQGYVCPPEDGARAGAVMRAAWRSRHSGQPEMVAPLYSTTPASMAAVVAADEPVGPEPLEFSIVVPTYNRPSQVRHLLESLAAQSYPRGRFEIVLVNDGGVSLQPVVEQMPPSLQVRYLSQDKNVGCAAARGLGCRHAQGRWLVFTDDDCRPAADWLTRLAQATRRDPDSAIGCAVINGLRHNWFSEAAQLLLEYLLVSTREGDAYAFIPTSGLAMPAAAFSTVAALEPDWRIAGGEDRYLCQRWRNSGRVIHRAEECVVVHYHSLHWGAFLAQQFGYGRGARLFRARLADRHEAAPGVRGLAFHRGLLRFAGRRASGWKACALAGLFLVAQAANGAGYFYQAMVERRLERSETERQAMPAKIE